MSKKLTLLLFTLFLSWSFASQASADKYYVYCANGKLEVDNRNLQQMQSARGSSTYMMSAFDYRTDAEKFAKQLGGIGAKCPRK